MSPALTIRVSPMRSEHDLAAGKPEFYRFAVLDAVCFVGELRSLGLTTAAPVGFAAIASALASRSAKRTDSET